MSIRLKTILGIALIESALLIMLIVMMMVFIRESNFEGLLKRASTTATLFATTTKDAVLSYNFASLESFVNEVLRNPDLVYARVVSTDGNVFAEAGDRSHLSSGQFKADAVIEDVLDDVYDTSADVAEGGVVYGRVEIGLHIGSVTQAIHTVTRWSMILATSEMALVALFSFFLGGYLTGQLKNLHQAARRVAGGDFDINIQARGRDEIAEVAHAFNCMAGNLKKTSEERGQYETRLLELNQSLENRVRKRTAELEGKNNELEVANQALKDTHAKLLHSEKMASVGVLAAGVAHEINNPVGFIMNNLATLNEYIEIYHRIIAEYEQATHLSDSQKRQALLDKLQIWMQDQDYGFISTDITELLKDSLYGTERIRDIVAGLKEFSHPEQADKFTMADLNQYIASTLKMLHNELKYKCQIFTELDNLPKTYCAPGQISQVLLNILVNAVHAIEEKGEIRIKSWEGQGLIHITIEDNGQGIEKEALTKLFDPFYTTKPVGQGTGLGLAISHGIISDHNGEINVTSEPGKGSCFTISLPVHTAPRPSADQEMAQPSLG